MDNIERISKYISKKIAAKEKLPDFFSLVRYIKQNNDVIGIEDETLRFSQIPHLKFTEGEIAGITLLNDKTALVNVYFFGLFGPNSPMPLEFTNFVLRRSLSYYDQCLAKFIDIINNRFIKLYYMSWRISNQAVSEDEVDGNFTLAMKSFSGYMDQVDTQSIALPKRLQLGFVDLFSYNCRNIDGLEQLLCKFFKLPFKISNNITTRHSIPKEFLSRLGQNESHLGKNIQLGSRYLSNTKRILISIGPLDLKQCFRFLPGGIGFLQIIELIKMYVPRPIKHSLCLILNKDSNIKTSLNGKSALGINVWLSSNACFSPELKITINSYNWAKKLHEGSYSVKN